MRNSFTAVCLGIALSMALANPAASGGPPQYEQAYVNNNTVTINAIEVPQKAPQQAQADFYQVVYPIPFESLGISPPQCNPCDHEGDGIDFIDFHDHVLDSMPSSPGHGEFSPLWHVFLVLPNYTNNLAHDTLVNSKYAELFVAGKFPARSEAAVGALLTTILSDNLPLAVQIDTHFYFLCAVVNPHASPPHR
jgi:hypothetical protein